jgi:serine/threonine-protein kinase
MPPRLVVIAGPDQGKAFSLAAGEHLVIGRGRTADVRLTDPHVSRSHCEVKVKGSRIVAEDLGSSSGIYVNDAHVRVQVLHLGDVLRIGSTLLRLEAEELADQATLALPPSEGRALLSAVTPAANATPPPLHELSGQALGHFRIGKIIGEGKTGVVFRALDTRDHETVALKVFLPGFASIEDEWQRFHRAMKTVLRLRHPHLVTVKHAGRTGEHCWVSMELVEGVSLVTAVEHAATASGVWPVALRVVLHVGRALAYLHARPIVHRNVAPANILLNTVDGTVKLSDLMTAKAQEGKWARDVTQAGEILGHLSYLSPEQTVNANKGDARADLYSLGATAYALLTGQPPLVGKNFVETILKIRQTPPVPPRQIQPSIPAPFEAVVLRLLAKRPEDRFQSANQLLAHLQQLGLG